MDASLLTFLGISAAVIVAPGPTRRSPCRNTFLGGRDGGILTAAGVSAGQVVWSVGTSLGLLAVLLTSETVFHAVKLLGAAYLGYLGVSRCALRFAAERHVAPSLRETPERLGGRGVSAGPLNNLANPKWRCSSRACSAVRPAGHGMLSVLVLLGWCSPSSRSCGSLSMRWLWLGPANSCAGPRPRAIDGTAGVALIGLGLSVATEGR
jgi:threonine/homoserine/homoserine lactone efflux protein